MQSACRSQEVPPAPYVLVRQLCESADKVPQYLQRVKSPPPSRAANINDFDSSSVADFDGIAFGCPAMGAEVLEDSEFEPVFNECESALNGKSIALFGSYGWGDGEWMRNWEDTCKGDGANLVCESVICNDAPDDDALEACKKLGASLA